MKKASTAKNTKTNVLQSKQSLPLWLQMFRMARSIDKHLRSRLRSECNTTMPRFEVLSTLDRAQTPLTMSQLSDQILVSNGNVTGLVHRLVGDGLVTRTPDPNDRRAHFISLTELGRTAFHIMEEQHLLWVEELFASVDSKNKIKLFKLLSTVEDGYQDVLSSDAKTTIGWTEHTFERNFPVNDKSGTLENTQTDDHLNVLTSENQRLKNLLAEQMLNNATLKHLLSQKM